VIRWIKEFIPSTLSNTTSDNILKAHSNLISTNL